MELGSFIGNPAGLVTMVSVPSSTFYIQKD